MGARFSFQFHAVDRNESEIEKLAKKINENYLLALLLPAYLSILIAENILNLIPMIWNKLFDRPYRRFYRRIFGK